jgi:hypothetical protein
MNNTKKIMKLKKEVMEKKKEIMEKKKEIMEKKEINPPEVNQKMEKERINTEINLKNKINNLIMM